MNFLRSSIQARKRGRGRNADPMESTRIAPLAPAVVVSGGRAAPKAASAKYFTNPGDQRKYYGIKRNLNYRKLYNLRDFWDMPIQRGSPYSRQLVGESYKLATPQQRMNRKSYMMSGRGKYMGGAGLFYPNYFPSFV